VADPFGDEGARLYRTGDLCRRREDGTIDFLGRMDQQVKLRGMRIELGEIEAVLRQVAGVEQAAVELRGEGEARRLVGYVSGAVEVEALRAGLEGRLPGYMVPGALVVLERLPVMQNGKVDRRALPEPEAGEERERVEARTEREARLLAVWRSVLGREEVGVTDNFFEVGGDSILSLQIIARAKDAGLKLTPRQVFEHPTVATLALVAEVQHDQSAPVPEIHEALPLTPIQQTFFERFPLGESHWNQSVLLKVNGNLDASLLERAVLALSDMHDALRLRFSRDDSGRWQQRVATREDNAIVERVDLRDSPQWTRALEEHGTRLQTSLHLEQGPIFRVGYFELERESRLLLVIHHLAVDGVSWRILLDDLQTLYEALAAGKAHSRAPSTPWSAWVAQQQAWAATDTFQSGVAWWREQLKDARADLPVHDDIATPATWAPQIVRTELSRDTTDSLLRHAPRAWRAGVEDVLLAALTQTLSAWSGGAGILVSLEAHGRELPDLDADVSQTVGWFTTQFPVWLPARQDCGRAIRDVKEQLRRVRPRGIGYGWLRNELRDLPAPRIGFNYLGQFDQSLKTGGRFSFAAESAGSPVSAAEPADMTLDLNGIVVEGCLCLNWRYRDGELRHDIVAQLAVEFEAKLQALIQHCVAAQPGATASDFPLAQLRQDEYERLDPDLSKVIDIYAASPVQQGVVFHTLEDADGLGVYVNQKRWTIRGDLDHRRMKAAWNAVIAHHDTLRTGFEWQHGSRVVQLVHRDATVPYEVRDWSQLGERYEEELARWMREDIGDGFDLACPPLMRVNVFRNPFGAYDLVWTDHHVLLDGWSVSQLLGEVLRHYAGESLPAQGGRYRDYIEWLQQRDTKADEAYWREQLAKLDGSTRLASALPRDGRQPKETGYGEHRVTLDAALTQRLEHLAREERVTVNTVIQAAWALMLQRYTGQRAVVFGATVSGRPADLVGSQQLLGLFINTLPVVLVPHAAQPVGDWLREVQAQGLSMREHEHTPLNEIQRWAGAGGRVLFDTLVVYENYPVDAALKEAAPGGLEFEMRSAREQTNYPLSIIATQSGRMCLEYRYERGTFADRSIQEIAARVTALLDAFCDDSRRAIGEMSVLASAEHAGLVALGSCIESYADVMPVHEQIAREAQAHPERVAVVYGETQLRYGELDAQANRLAQRLVKLGVGPEVRVGIAVERSVEMVVGLLAILKAGGAYVPLDPEYPRERLAYMLEDSRVALLLTQSWVRERLPVAEGVTVLELDTVDVSTEPAVAPQVRVQGENLAYVIYTSGSTGRPKGAQLTHRNVARLLAATHPWFDFDASDVWTMFHSYAFDFSVWEIFGALCHGGKLVVVPYLVSRSPEEFAQLLRRERVTVLNQTPSAFRQLMQVPQMADPDLALRTVIFGGEALDPQTLASWVQRFGDAKPRLVNMYGITETTVHVTYRPVVEADTCAQRSPLGRAIPDLGLYVLDLNGNLAPVGVAGELHVSGAGLARGYLNRPALSAGRFVPDPFDANGGRLYRTGDLARWTQDGELEYLGRIDHQVKVRGFRIELGEIEAQLLALHGVREAIVLAQERPGGARLVAYVTAHADHAIEPQALRASLGDVLPDYMVPSVVMVLDTLPLTSNGKVDRNALPAPEYGARGYEAPQGEAEVALAQIWSEVLGIEQVSRTDNFFELGGDSILSLQIVARARQAGWQVSARQLFERQTVALLAGVAQRAKVLETVDDESGEVSLLPIQKIFFEQTIPNRHHWNQAVLLESPEPLDAAALEIALSAVISHHGALRIRFNQDSEGNWRQAYTDTQPTDVLWTYDVTGDDDIEAHCNNAHRSLNIETGAVLRAVSMRLADGTSRLLLVIHHLVMDGVSWRVLLEDLQAAYAQVRSGEKPALPARSASYRRWSQAVAAHARTLGGELDYWRDVAGTPADIPLDHADGAQTVEASTGVSISLTREQTHALLHDAPSAYRTQINDLLLTALGRALCAWSGRESIRIDVEGHGREDIEDGLDISRTVGWFTSMYPVKLEPVGELRDAICRVKESLRAVPGRGLGYGLLRYLGDAQTRQAFASQQPSQVVFNYLGQFDEVLSPRTGTGWRLAEAGVGEMQDPAATPAHALSIDGGVYADRLKLTITDAAARYPADVIERLAAAFHRELEQIVAHCAQAAPRATPSDFPLARLTLAQLDAWPAPLADIRDIYPASATQNGMLFHSLHTPGAYVNQVRVDVDDLDVARFAQAWRALSAAEDILRTGFCQIDGAWLQWVASKAELALREFDWRSESQSEAKLDALADDDRAAGIDVTRAPLMRLTVVRTGERRHHLVWTHHHVLLDGWSVSQLLGEVLRHYAGESLPAQGGRYRDYIEWLQQRDTKADEAYWREQLAKLDGSTWLANALPRDGRQPKETGYGEHRVTLDAALTQRLEHLAREERVTVNTVIQAAWALMLQRYTGQRAVVFGATVSGRPADLAGSQQLLGLFINTLPVVLVPHAAQPVGDWLREVQAQGLSMREHEHTPLNEIQRWAGAGGRGLFDTLVVYENYPVDAALKEVAPGGLKFGEVASREETNYPLTITIMPADKLRIDWTFAHEHFDDKHVAALIERFERVLRQICADCGCAVGSLVIELPDETAALLAKGTCSEAYEDVMPVHERIAREAQAHPERVAVVYGETQLRYGELDAQANRLAQRLVKLGVGPEMRVGIAVERSVEMVVGLLAILKAGGAYVPLDPEYPRERLAYMLEDSGVALLLTQSWVRERLPVAEGVTVLELDTLDVSTEPAAAPQVRVQGGNLAYVIYTSGSTGRPKGAANRHSALSNRLAWMQSAYALDETDGVLQKTPFSFDVSVWEFFWPLMTGARLAVAEPGAHRDPQRLVELIREQRVTTLHFVPSMLQAFVAHKETKNCTTLKRIVCSGEALPADLANRTLEQLPNVGLYNLYGPTEAAIDVTHWTCRTGDEVVPIGRPIGNVSTHVLDAQMNLVPQGVAGELYLGGAGLARGYLNRAALSAERFVPDPFDANGGRLYRTG
ncbi:non-ribosomal peptide synthetase, partial [Paraburkholderia ferrariae]|uniref:non-ribosomal peptide synthetase n=1 Tax=Paraburkholderia ferrariae TaxID=386056 RepID=UPI00047F4212